MALSGTKALLRWCQHVTEGYDNVHVTNMTTSWRDGLAFCAILHHFKPDVIDYYKLSKENIAENNGLAFTIAEKVFGIPALLDVEDMVAMSVPDKLSIMTYVSQYYAAFRDKTPAQQNQRKMSATKRPLDVKGGGQPPKKQAPLHFNNPPGISATKEVVGSPPKVSLGRTTHVCAECGKPVYLMERLNAENRVYHRTCFRCSICGTQLRPSHYRYIPSEKKFYCDKHYRTRTVSTNSEDENNQEKQNIPNIIRNFSFGKKTKQEPNLHTHKSSPPRNTVTPQSYTENRTNSNALNKPINAPELRHHHDFDIYRTHNEDAAQKKHEAKLTSGDNGCKDARSYLSSALTKQLETDKYTRGYDLTRISSVNPSTKSQREQFFCGSTAVTHDYVKPVERQQYDLTPQSKRTPFLATNNAEYSEPHLDGAPKIEISANPFIRHDKEDHEPMPLKTVKGRNQNAPTENGNTEQNSQGVKKKLVLKVKKKKVVDTAELESNASEHSVAEKPSQPVQRQQFTPKSERTPFSVSDNSKYSEPNFNGTPGIAISSSPFIGHDKEGIDLNSYNTPMSLKVGEGTKQKESYRDSEDSEHSFQEGRKKFALKAKKKIVIGNPDFDSDSTGKPNQLLERQQYDLTPESEKKKFSETHNSEYSQPRFDGTSNIAIPSYSLIRSEKKSQERESYRTPMALKGNEGTGYTAAEREVNESKHGLEDKGKKFSPNVKKKVPNTDELNGDSSAYLVSGKFIKGMQSEQYNLIPESERTQFSVSDDNEYSEPRFDDAPVIAISCNPFIRNENEDIESENHLPQLPLNADKDTYYKRPKKDVDITRPILQGGKKKLVLKVKKNKNLTKNKEVVGEKNDILPSTIERDVFAEGNEQTNHKHPAVSCDSNSSMDDKLPHDASKSWAPTWPEVPSLADKSHDQQDVNSLISNETAANVVDDVMFKEKKKKGLFKAKTSKPNSDVKQNSSFTSFIDNKDVDSGNNVAQVFDGQRDDTGDDSTFPSFTDLNEPLENQSKGPPARPLPPTPESVRAFENQNQTKQSKLPDKRTTHVSKRKAPDPPAAPVSAAVPLTQYHSPIDYEGDQTTKPHLETEATRKEQQSIVETISEEKLTREEIHIELREIEKQQRQLEKKGVAMEKMLREKLSGEPEEEYMVEWFNLVTEKNRLLRRENELIYLCQEHDYLQNQKSIESELRQLLEKDDRLKSNADRRRENELLEKMVSFVYKRSSIVDKLEEDRVREKEEDEQITLVMEAQGLLRDEKAQGKRKSTFYC